MPHKLLQISQSVRTILPDTDRVDLVPGVAHRRALFLQAARATTTLRSWRSVGTETPPMLQLRLAIHDCVCIAQVSTLPRSELELFKRDPELLHDNGDVFLTAAAVGDTEFIETHFAKFFQSPEDQRAAQIFRRMKRLARDQGFEALVVWLQNQQSFIVAEPNEPMAEVDMISADLTQLQFSPSTTPPDSPEHVVASTGSAAAVLTNRSLMEHIGSYQESPSAFVAEYRQRVVGDPANKECIRGVLVHHAIIFGDLHALQMLYTACLLDQEVAMKPETSFFLSMHLAACEGRLDFLRWLHARYLRHPAYFLRCPDTLAMGVRCGWSEIVEWLYLNFPESGRTMSEYAVNDAAHWGHVDVLRVCHKYRLGKFTDRTMVCAARAGRLEAIKLLRSLEGLTLGTSEAMDVAIEGAHVDIVVYFRDQCNEIIDERRLSISLRSEAASADAVVQLLWAHADHEVNARQRAATLSFELLCSKRSDQIIMLVLPFVAQDPATLLLGLQAAVESNRPSIVRMLLPLCIDGWKSSTKLHHELLELFNLALRLDNAMIASLLMDAGQFAPQALGSTFRHVVEQARGDDLSILLELHLDEYCDDAFVVVAEAGDVDILERLHPKRTQATAIEALRVAKNMETAQFLLMNEDEFYTERIVLEHAPPCIEPKLIRFLLREGHQPNPDAVASFADIQYEPSKLLEPHEVRMIKAADDPVLTSRLVARHTNLLSSSFVSKIIYTGMYDLVGFLHHDLALTELTTHELNNLIESGQLDDVQALFELGVRDVSEESIRKILRKSRMTAVQFLFDQLDDDIDNVFMDVLADALAQSHEDIESHCGGVRSSTDDRFGWALSLLQLFVQQRPALHDTLLIIAAGAGSVPAVTYMLSPRSGVDTTTMAMLPAIVAAARSGFRDLVEMLFTAKRVEEVINVAVLREQLCSVGDANALQLVLSVAAARDPAVQKQLDAERNAASVLFGFGPATSSGAATRPLLKRKSSSGRSKPGRRW